LFGGIANVCVTGVSTTGFTFHKRRWDGSPWNLMGEGLYWIATTA
jgi:hypothetical protein